MTFRTSHCLLIPVLSFSMFLTTTAADAQEVVPPVAVPSSAASEARAQSLLLSAKTVSLVDLGTDANFPPGDLNGSRKIGDLLTSWGRYQVLPNSSKADVTLHIEGLTRTGYVSPTDDSAGYTTYSPFYKVTIVDPVSGEALWDITTPVLSGKSRGEDLFQMSLRNVVSSLKTFEGLPLSQKELKDVRYLDRQRTKGAWMIAGLSIVLVGAAVGTGIIMKDKYDAAVARDNEQSHEFCVEHHIPGC
jgi:hypothetical protein